jgi:hypothetical protein
VRRCQPFFNDIGHENGDGLDKTEPSRRFV